MKVTHISQELRGPRIFEHALLTVKGGVADSPEIVIEIAGLLGLVFSIVTFLALLVFPTKVFLPKFSEAGLIDSVPIAVAVAVGVVV